jgi:hypothetical protein
VFKDAVSDNTVTEEDADALIDPSKDTNEDHLYYFAHMSNHYLHLVKASLYLSITSWHQIQFPIITDSGANFHLFKEREFFEYISPASGRVIGDGKTSLPIQGIGAIKCKIGDDIWTVEGIRNNIGLAKSIYSLFFTYQCRFLGYIPHLKVDCMLLMTLLPTILHQIQFSVLEV